MLRLSLVASTLICAALLGCQSDAENPSTPPHAVTHQELLAIRQSFQRADPAVRVGLVMASDVPARLAAVGDVDVNDFHGGDVVSFLDSNRATLSLGTVDSVVNDMVIVRFEVQPGGRAPQAGDLAVRAVP